MVETPATLRRSASSSPKETLHPIPGQKPPSSSHPSKRRSKDMLNRRSNTGTNETEENFERKGTDPNVTESILPHHSSPKSAVHRLRSKHLPTILRRSPMGEYVPEKGQAPLSSLAIPTPGPLDYAPKLSPSGQQYSILGKHEEMKSEIPVGPGPAKYNIRGKRDRGAGYSLGMRFQRDDVISGSPGPLYNVNWRGVGTECTGTKLSGRYPPKESDNPSPNKYMQLSTLGQGPAFTMASRAVELADSHPGPTDYDVHFPAPRPPACVISGRHGETFDLSEASKLPAPNQYDPKMETSNVVATLKERFKESKSMKTPGPANYIISDSLNTGPSYSIVGRNVSYEDEAYFDPPPGPGSYNPKDCLTTNRVPDVTLRPSRRSAEKVKDTLPGPGSYQPRQYTIKANNAPKVTMKGKHQIFTDLTPGPGYYNLSSTIGDPNRPPRGLFPEPNRQHHHLPQIGRAHV